MKGLDLAEAFYREQGAAMLAEQVPACCSRIAAGMVGPGSECFGFDDRWSRDHDWGPGFCLWLSEEDHQSVGKELQRAYKRLPDRFMGFGPRKTSPGEAWRVGVIRTRDFFTRLTGLDHPPESIAEWLRIPEHALAACVNGRVFTDPLGDVTGWRQAIGRYYPDDIRLKKIASRCITVAQSGQYNFPRALQRGAHFAADAARIQFCTDMISLVFLLNCRFMPFFKWIHRAVADLPILGATVHAQVDRLLASPEPREQAGIMEDLSEQAIQALRSQKLSNGSSDFLLDHAAAVHEKINDARLGQRLTVIP
jgi:hypothetical protein